MAYARVEPFGEDWARSALLCSVVANANCGRPGRRFDPADFMPGGRQLEEEQSPDEMKASIRAFVEQFHVHHRQPER